MDEAEFARRLAVYVERDLPDFAHAKDRIAETLAAGIWPTVDGWQKGSRTAAEVFAWIGELLQDQWPDAAEGLSLAMTGAPRGWFPDDPARA